MAHHWARVRLAQGQSAAAEWALSPEVSEARLVVGSGVKAGWIVNGPEIAEVHFQFAWDGQALWIGPMGAAIVSVDGLPVATWQRLGSRHEIRFGAGMIRVETSDSPAAQRDERPTAADPALEEPPTWDDGPTSVYSDEIRITAEETRMANLEAIEQGRSVAAPRLGGLASGEESLPGDARGTVPHPEASDPGTGPGLFQPPPPKRVSSAPKERGPIPIRTWVLLGVTIIVSVFAVIFITIKKQREARAERVQVQAENRRHQLLAEEAAARVRQEIQEHVAAIHEQEESIFERTRPDMERAIVRAVEIAEAEAGDLDEEDLDEIRERAKRTTAERLAVDALVANNYASALAHYRYLHREFPSDRTYEAMLPILRAKVRCRNGRLPDGRPCR